MSTEDIIQLIKEMTKELLNWNDDSIYELVYNDTLDSKTYQEQKEELTDRIVFNLEDMIFNLTCVKNCTEITRPMIEEKIKCIVCSKIKEIEDWKFDKVRVKMAVRGKLEEGMKFDNYKQLFMVLGLQRRDKQLGGNQRDKLKALISEFVRVERVDEGRDEIIITELYV